MVVWATALVWIVLQFWLLRPPSIAPFWRQAETQSMALNLAQREFNPLYPQINWGGDGPGYVEAELPLYQTLMAPLLAWTQGAEWPGQILSLVCAALCASVLFTLLERRFGPGAALFGALYSLTSTLGVQLSIAVMPDMLGGLLYLVALERFLSYVEAPSLRSSLTSSVALALAACIKPHALHLGIAEFLIVVLSRRELLRAPALWIGWGLTVSAVSAHLLHGVQIHAVYGNSFGVVSGADSKFPALSDLISVEHLYNLTQVSLHWGVGFVPLALGVWTLLRGKWTAVEWSLAIANVIALFVSLRYSILPWAGAQYHLYAMFFGAMLVAQAAADLIHAVWHVPRVRPALYGAAAASLVVSYAYSVHVQRALEKVAVPAPIVEISKSLLPLVEAGDLVVMQSDEDAWDSHWNRSDNYQDPRGFYVTHTRGWVLPRDQARPEDLARFSARGARYYVVAGQPPTGLRDWLDSHARVEHQDPWGTIYALPADPGTESALGARAWPLNP
jgi:hypothetical protein